MKAVILLIMVCIAVFFLFGRSSTNSINYLHIPGNSPSPTPFTYTPKIPFSPSTVDMNINHWKTYSADALYGGAKFTQKYPSEWEFFNDNGILTYYPYGVLDGDMLRSPRIILNAGGHGGAPVFTQRNFPAGALDYSWHDQPENDRLFAIGRFESDPNNSVITEIWSIPSEDKKEMEALKVIFDQMLYSFTWNN